MTIKGATSQTPVSPSIGRTNAADRVAWRLHDERPRHLRYLRSRLASVEDAEDALQDATLNFMRNAEALAAADKPEAWIGASLRHTVIDRYRRLAAKRRLTDALVSESLVAEKHATPPLGDDETLTATECLEATLSGLRPDYATLLRWVYLDGDALKDAADRARLTANNAAVRLHRARGALRKAMQARCGSCPLLDCLGRQNNPAVAAPTP